MKAEITLKADNSFALIQGLHALIQQIVMFQDLIESDGIDLEDSTSYKNMVNYAFKAKIDPEKVSEHFDPTEEAMNALRTAKPTDYCGLFDCEKEDPDSMK